MTAPPQGSGPDAPLAQRLSEGQRRATPVMRDLMRATGAGVDAAIDRALAVAGAQCGADRAYVFRIEPGGRISNTHEWCRAGIAPQRDTLQGLPLSIIDDWLPLLHADEAFDLPCVSALPAGDPVRAQLERQGIHALVVAPLCDGGQLAGFVGFDAVNPRPPFDPGETALLRAIADAIGAALARHDAEQRAAAARAQALAAERDLDRLARVVEVMTNLVVIVDPDQRIVWVNRAFEAQTGQRAADLVGRDFAAVIRGPGSDAAAVAALRAAVGRRESLEGEAVGHDAAGRAYWIRFNLQPLFDRDGRYAGHVSIETVITDRKALERELAARNAFLAGVIDTSASAIVAMDAAGEVVFANAAAQALLGLAPDADAPGRFRKPDWAPETPEGAPLAQDRLPAALVLATGAALRDARYALRRPDGTRRLLSANAAPLPVPVGEARIVLSLTDVTEAAATRKRLRRLAEEDPLTRLCNRRALAARAGPLVAAAGAGGARVALLMLDLDNFKAVNDTLRHDSGDAVLCAVADRLRAAAPPRAVVARMGGDEFMLAVPGLGRPGAVALAERLRSAVADPLPLGGHRLHLTASVGVALAPEHGADLAQLMSGADVALYAAKRAGRDRVAVLSAALFAAEARRSAIVRALGAADLTGALRLAFQPQFALPWTAGAPLGAEALVRWFDPALGEVGPTEFVPLAEETGQIQRIDLAVVALAARQFGRWVRMGWAGTMGVNVSAHGFARPGLAEAILARLAAEGAPPDRFTVELTETALVALSPAADRNVATLRRAGAGIAIDDFGTGYASLSYLQRLDVTGIKIDRSFVHGLDSATRNDSGALIRAVLGMAGALGLATTAEGVETQAQCDWLAAAGCARMQGFLAAAPMSPAAFEARFVARGPGPSPGTKGAPP